MKSLLIKRIIIFIFIMGLLLMCSCRIDKSPVEKASDKSPVEKALGALLNCDNYKSVWSIITDQSKASGNNAPLLIFHNPYKSKCVGVFDKPDDQGMVSGAEYEIQDGNKYKQKLIYTYENGETKGVEFENKTNEEYLVEQIKDCLISEKFIGDQVVEGTNVKEYKISVTPFPFGKYLGVPYDKNDFRTRIFMDEYKTCEGEVYINPENNYIQKIQFDLSDKLKLNKEIIDKITTGVVNDPNFTMDNINNFIITIDISDINDNSKEIEDTKKEIDSIMQ